MDPKEGDIGIVVVADRDISAVKNSKKQSPPGSKRKMNVADGIYISTVIADKPDCYIRFTDDKKIIAAVGSDNPVEVVVAEKYVQMKKKGNSALHVTIDVENSQIIMGMAAVIGPDPFPNN